MFVDEAALGSDPEHRARISAVLREGLLRDTFAQVIVLAGRDDFQSADFDRHLVLTAGSSAAPPRNNNRTPNRHQETAMTSQTTYDTFIDVCRERKTSRAFDPATPIPPGPLPSL